MTDPLDAITPLDGRYAATTAPFRRHTSEAALMRARARIEVEYLIALADLEAIPFEVDDEARDTLHSWIEDFDDSDATKIKQIEVEGTEEHPATNHDVKAVEYWLRDRLTAAGLETAIPFAHFGLTSEDVNNLAYRLLLRRAIVEELIPALEELINHLTVEAKDHRQVAMLGRTHGQPASPTTYGKELAVFVQRLIRGQDRLAQRVDGLQGKFGGATGTFAAHAIAEPNVDWPAFAETFVQSLGFRYGPLTTQVNPNDDIAAVFDALANIATILVDFDRDMWRYISDEYLIQEQAAGEVGSSTMPHKVNPIDFENSEGNLLKARSDLRFLADTLPISRLQRDLSDSTIHRSMGGALAHWYLGVTKALAGTESVAPNPAVMDADLKRSPAVLAEAVQTALRRIGDPDAYERLKSATRGQTVDPGAFDSLIEEIEAVDPVLGERLAELEPATYIGLAAILVDELEPT